MDDANIIAQLSEAISAAAADASLWPVFLEQFAHATRSNRMVLHREVMDRSRQGHFNFSYGATGTFTEEYERYYGPRNPIFTEGRSILLPGRPGLRQEACDDDTFLSSEYYNDFLRPNDTLQIFGAVLIQDGASILVISANGSHSREPYADRELRLLGAMIPHLQTTLRLQDRLRMLERQTRKAQAAFDTIPDAALLVDKAGIILAANRAASYLLAGRAGLSADEDRLRIRDRHLHSKLSRILQGIALAHEFNLPAPAGGAIRVTRPSGAPDWLLQIFPVEKKMPGAALVLIVSAGTDSPSESDLAKLFNLSTMQAQISLRLFEGQPANEIGDGLGISRNTLKTHVRRLFEKLGVTRQTELMRLLSKLKSRS